MTDEEMIIRADQRSKSNEHRIDKLEQDVDSLQKNQNAIYQLAASVQVIAQQTKTTSEDVKTLSGKIDEQGKKIDKQDKDRIEAEKALEGKITAAQNAPAIKRSETISKVGIGIITAVCSSIATLFLSQLVGM